MRLVILDDYEKASLWAAKYIMNAINKFESDKNKSKSSFVLGLPTGYIVDYKYIPNMQ